MNPKPPKPRKNGRKRMNARQAALLKNLSKGMTQKQAAINAGYSEKHADKVAHQTLTRMQENWGEHLEAVIGNQRSVLEKYLVPLMNARHQKAFNHNGKVVYSKPMVAWGPRRDGLDIYCKIAGAYKMPEIGERGPIQVQVITNVTLPDPGLSGTNGHKSTELPIDTTSH